MDLVLSRWSIPYSLYRQCFRCGISRPLSSTSLWLFSNYAPALVTLWPSVGTFPVACQQGLIGEFTHFSHFSFGFTCEWFRREFSPFLGIVLLSLLLLFVCYCSTFCNSAGLQSEWKTPLGALYLVPLFHLFQIVLPLVNRTSMVSTCCKISIIKIMNLKNRYSETCDLWYWTIGETCSRQGDLFKNNFERLFTNYYLILGALVVWEVPPFIVLNKVCST
jgi:hypothetical protein